MLVGFCILSGWGKIMSNNPAFLFYVNDWYGGVIGWKPMEKYSYFELLLAQFSQGHLSKELINRLIGEYETWDFIKQKFVVDSDGLFFNKRMDEVKEKREKYSNGRRKNKLSGLKKAMKSNTGKGKKVNNICTTHVKDMLNTCSTYDEHMGNGNGNGNISISRSSNNTLQSNKTNTANNISQGNVFDSTSNLIDTTSISNTKDWRKDYEEYLKIVTNDYDELMQDSERLSKQEKYYPNIDIKLSIEKGFVNFWGTDLGWMFCKKKRKGKTLDMKRTLLNAIDLNKVWKPKQSQNINDDDVMEKLRKQYANQ